MVKDIKTIEQVAPDAAMTPEASMTPEQMKADLKSGHAELKTKEGALNSRKLINENELEDLKGKIVREMFKLMQKAGIDPENLESIRDFLEQMEQTNPDIAEMFKLAFGGITKDEQFIKEPEGPEESADTEGLMNRFNNLGPAMMRGGTPPMGSPNVVPPPMSPPEGGGIAPPPML